MQLIDQRFSVTAHRMPFRQPRMLKFIFIQTDWLVLQNIKRSVQYLYSKYRKNRNEMLSIKQLKDVLFGTLEKINISKSISMKILRFLHNVYGGTSQVCTKFQVLNPKNTKNMMKSTVMEIYGKFACSYALEGYTRPWTLKLRKMFFPVVGDQKGNPEGQRGLDGNHPINQKLFLNT